MTEPEMWEAVQRSDASYDGLFFYAVKTTGISAALLQIKAAEAGKSLLFCIRRRSPPLGSALVSAAAVTSWSTSPCGDRGGDQGAAG